MRAPLKLGATEDAPTLGIRAPAVTTDVNPGAPANAAMAAQAYGSLAERLDALAQQGQRRADIATQTRMLEAGAAAGDARPGTQMQGGGDVAQEAFNRGALEAGQRRLEINVRERLNALVRQHEADPAAFGDAAVAYRDGVATSLPPGMRPGFLAGFDALAQPFHNAAVRQADQVQADERVASFAEADRLRIPNIEAYARMAARDPAAAKALELEQAHYTADLIALGPRAAFRFGGVEYPADPTRAGAVSLVQMEERKQALHDRAIGAAAMGAYEAGPRSAGWIDAWEKHELSPNASGLLPERVRGLAREMRADLAHRTAMARDAQTAAWSNVEGTLTANLQAVQLTGREQTPITDAELRATGRTPQFIQRYRNQVAFGAASFTAQQDLAMASPERLAAMKARAMPGGDLFALNPAGAAGLVHLFDQRSQNAAETGLAQRVKDLQAQAEATAPDASPVPRLTAQEVKAAGWTAEHLAAANDQITLIEKTSRAARKLALASPDEAAAAVAALPVAGDQAAEHRFTLHAVQQVLEDRAKGIAKEPADYVLRNSPATRDAWTAALKDSTQLPAAIGLTLAQQDHIGVPPAQRQALPTPVAQQLAQSIMQAPTAVEQVARLNALLAGIPDATSRGQVLTSIGKAGLPEGVRIGAGILERAGPLVASRVASEQAVPMETLKLPPALQREVRDTTAKVFDANARIGGLRNAQYAATGNAAFLDQAARERQILEHSAKVRAAPAGATSISGVTQAYGDIFGGQQVVNRTGYLLTAPAAADAQRLQAGLATLLDHALAGATPAQRMVAQRGAWIDYGTGQYAFYPAGSPAPLARDGKPVVATLEQALGMPAAMVDAQRSAERRRAIPNMPRQAP